MERLQSKFNLYCYANPLTDSIVQETTRLSSGVFMVRYVTADTRFTTGSGQEYLIREGDRVAMYPPALHKDPEIFEDPLVSGSRVTVALQSFATSVSLTYLR